MEQALRRQDGTATVTEMKETQDGQLTVEPRANGAVEIGWQDKYRQRISRNAKEQDPANATYAYLARQGCPIGYTEYPLDAMPISGITGAILTRIEQSGLSDPHKFVQPKVIGTAWSIE